MANDIPQPVQLDRLDSAGSTTIEHTRPLPLLYLCLLALTVGVVTGLGAVVFRGLIGLVHNVMFLGQLSFALRFQRVHAASAVGRVRHSGSGTRRHRRDLHRLQLRARGEGPWRSGSDGRDLLQPRRDPTDRRGGEVARVGGGDRHRRGGRTRRTDHPDRLRARLDLRPAHPHVDGTAHHPGRGRRRRRHRRDIQHADRRRAVRHRTDDAGDQRQHAFFRWRSPPAPQPSSAACSSAPDPRSTFPPTSRRCPPSRRAR